MTPGKEGASPELLFDFGRGTAADAERVFGEIEQRKLPPRQLSDADQQSAEQAAMVGSDFVRFVTTTLFGLRLLGPDAPARPQHPTRVEVPANAPPTITLRALWNTHAPTWATAVSPYTYHAIMQTILQFFRANDKKTGERILSIGAGPGIYETYLGGVLSMVPPTAHAEVLSLDSAFGMTAQHQRVIAGTQTIQGQPISNVRVVNGDMDALPFPDDSIDQILAIDALQWTPNWKVAIAEMARVMNPHGLRWVYLILREKTPLFQPAHHAPILDSAVFSIPTVLDALEANGFQPTHVRQFALMQKEGAENLTATRVFIQAQHMPEGDVRSWRTSVPSFTFMAMSTKKK